MPATPHLLMLPRSHTVPAWSSAGCMSTTPTARPRPERARGAAGAARTVSGYDGPPDAAGAAAVVPRGAPPAALGADRRAGAAPAGAAAAPRPPLPPAGGWRRGTP